MKVLLFTDSLGAGGAQRQLVGLAVMLKNRGYDVKVCTYFDIDFFKPTLVESHVPYEVIPRAESEITRILVVAKYFKKESPDWIIAYQETPSLVACVGKLLGGKYRLIVSERNTSQKDGMNERVRFFLYHIADVIVPNSYSQERWLKEHRPDMSNKIITITNFVDLELFTPNPHQRREIPEVLIAASIWESKNTLGLIHACRLLKEKGVKVHFSWYGKLETDIEYGNQCEDLIDDLDVGQYIDLLPKTKEITAKYQDADYFCLPSFYEGTPNVICEAMASGLPIICSNVCDNPFYVHEGEIGFLFDPKSPEHMAAKIQEALSITDDTYQIFCKRSRSLAEELLSGEMFIDKYLKIIEV